MKKGVNKFGIKLEDYSDYASYRRACNAATSKAWVSTEEGKLAKCKADAKYRKTEKGRLQANARDKKYFKTEKGKASIARYNFSVNGRKVKYALNAKRRSSKLQRTPAWADLEAIKQFYLNCPKGYHVDHDVPLQGVNVSGLHVLNNLVYLTASDNVKKGNKWPHNYSAQNGSNSNLAIV